MTSNTPAPLRIALLGATGIGRFHVREFSKTGAEIVAILGSSAESAATTAAKLAPFLAPNAAIPSALCSLDEVYARDLDAIAIATPDELHYEATLRALLGGQFVFCEKPLFWQDGLSSSQARPMLAELAMAGARERLCVNTSNASFITALRARDQVPRNPFSFRFSLQTNGKDEGLGIGVDLLPHAFSLLYEWAATEDLSLIRLTNLQVNWTQHRFETRFTFHYQEDPSTAIECHFLFEVHPNAKKRMVFMLNDVEFERIQRTNAAGGYFVSLKGPDGEHSVEDPFSCFINGFVSAIASNSAMPVDFETSSRILLNSIEVMETAERSQWRC
ncbi:MAG: putative dehydrogenase [Planctomycetota bacterium]|jgi:predicted dehydrogenase